MRPRTRLWLLNGGGLLLALLASMLSAGRGQESHTRVAQVAPRVQPIEHATMPDGSAALRDASGTLVPVRAYQRIASVSLVADHVLTEICEPGRLLAVTGRSMRNPYFGHLHAGRASLETLEDLEAILALDPDLLVSNHFGDPRFAARLRERGVTLFDLGEMHGLETLLPNIRTIATLIGEPARGERMAARVERRMAAVARDVPETGRPRALFLSVYGKQLFGGARGTSYRDVILAAGLRDAAGDRYEGWPSFDAEQVLALDPDVLVTKEGMTQTICRHPGMETLRACGPEGRVVELDIHLVDDPGPPMIDMAEALHAAVYGDSAAP